MPSLPIKRNCFPSVVRKAFCTGLVLLTLFAFNESRSHAESEQSGPASQPPPIKVDASFAKKEFVLPTELIALTLSRSLETSEGSLGVFIGNTDVTTMFDTSTKRLSYSPQALRLPSGENPLIVFLVSPSGHWTELAHFTLRVKDPNEPTTSSVKSNGHRRGFDSLEVQPSLTLNVKAQSALLYFPQTERPDRINSIDFAFQGNLQSKFSRNKLMGQSQFDLVGTSVQKEALRFADEANDAPQIDLSSYLIQFQVKKVKLQLGQYSYGTNRYLINGFSSRGLNVSVPIGTGLDVSFNAVNGTSIVGWNNFTGLGKQDHKIFAGTIGYEVFQEHPGWLRFEAGLLKASRQALNNYNQSTLTDVETSDGVGARLVASDKNERLRLEVGFGQSRFDNPSDPLLNQGFSVVPVRETSRSAHYLELSLKVLKDVKVDSKRKANLDLTFRHNRVDPLFRSIAVFAQADKLDNQFELTGNIGEITATVGHNRLDDNLDDVPSILKTLTRRNGFNVAVPLSTLWTSKAGVVSWLPRVSYSYDRVHAFGAFLPVSSDFAVTHVPDQASTNQTVNADWQRDKVRFSYRFNHSLQDNRQAGRASSDFTTTVNSMTVGITPNTRLEFNFDLSAERARNLEVSRLDQTWRTTVSANFQTSKKSTLAATISTAFAGDALNSNESRNADLDLQWSWRFGIEKDKYRKVLGQFFVRYANRYTRATDNIFIFTNLTKLQTMSAGLTFTFF